MLGWAVTFLIVALIAALRAILADWAHSVPKRSPGPPAPTRSAATTPGT